MQAYSEPYPRYVGGAGQTAARLSGRQVVEVKSVQGTWALVSVDGTIVGWVDGRRLLPPVGAPVVMAPSAMPAPEARTPPATVSLTAGTIIGALASIGILIGAVIEWTQGIASVTSFKVPVQFLFNNHTTARDPRLGYFLILLGLAGIAVSLLVRAPIWRFLIGLLALAAAAVFCIQIARGLEHTRLSFGDVVGAGPWVTGVSGFVLMLSPLVTPRY